MQLIHRTVPLLALGLTLSGQVHAATLIESLLADTDPCSGVELSENVFGLAVKIGLQPTSPLRIDRVSLAVEGDTARIDLAGGLSCETTPGSVLSGDAELDIEATAGMDLAGCTVEDLTLTPTRFGGYLADLLEAGWGPILGPYLTAETEGLLVRACQDLTAPDN